MQIFSTLFLTMFITLYFANTGVTQNIFISNGEKLSTELVGFDIIGRVSNNELLVYKKYRFKDEVEVYDAQMNLRRRKDITIKGSEYESNEVIKLGNQVFHFYTLKGSKKNFLYAQMYTELLEKKGDALLIDSTSRRMGSNFSAYTIKPSKNNEYAMVYQIEYTSGKISNLVSAVINNTGKIVGINQLEIPKTNFTAEITKAMVSNNGMPVFLLRNLDFSCKKEKAEIAFLLACGVSKGSYVTTPINDSENNCLREMQVEVDNSTNHVIVSGILGEVFRNAMVGYVFMQVDPHTGTIISHNAQSFSPELLTGISAKTDKSEKYTPVYKMSQVIPRADGGALVVSEYFEKTTENYDFTNYDPYYGYRTSTRQVDYFEYNDIFLMSISPEGFIDWTNIIRKRQISKEDNGAYSSYALANGAERIFFIYNEDISQNSNVMQYEMLADGTLNRKSLFNPAKQEVELRPQAARQVAFNEIIIPSIHKRSLSFISIVF